MFWNTSSPGQATNCDRPLTWCDSSALAPTCGCWLTTSTPVAGSMPARESACTSVPCPAEPTLAETFCPARSASRVAGESVGTTTMFSAPLGL
ncbi:Uncharacterised protein [Mycobacteroides abscessus subsp. abscessus]|nr:Uncharacterised protein [Mycobacteroides abscessus subsp. abscessus]